MRLYIVNAGPNSSSAFHVIGALFSHDEARGYPPNAQGMRQTIDVPPGDGALVELTFAEPGTYPFVTHKFSRRLQGGHGPLQGLLIWPRAGLANPDQQARETVTAFAGGSIGPMCRATWGCTNTRST